MAELTASRTQALKDEALKHLRVVLRNLCEIRRRTGVAEIVNLRNFLHEVGFKEGPEVADPQLTQTIDLEASARQKILEAEGGSVSAEEAARKLGISKIALIKRYKNGELLAWLTQHQKAFRFPAWQFRDRQVLAGLAEVLEELDHGNLLDDLDCMLFFLSNMDLLGGKRPLDFLRNGELQQVIQTAQAYVE